jgi:hypothetical protein
MQMKLIKRALPQFWFQFGLMLMLFLALNIQSREAVAEIPVSCRDPRGCPDFTAAATEHRIEFKAFKKTDCAVVEGEVGAPGNRKLLRFSFTTPNIGNGDIIIGNPHDAENEGLFQFNTCHGHPHFVKYAAFRLWSIQGFNEWDALRKQHPGGTASDILNANPELKGQFISGAKRGFCMVDSYHYDESIKEPRKYLSCKGDQGVSRGHADVYGQQLDGQWIDITGIKHGSYILEVEVNPDLLYTEIDYSNNRFSMPVRIP